MGQFKKAGDPQGYAYKSGDTILNGDLAGWDPTVTAKGQSASNGAVRPLPAAIGNSGFFMGVFEGQVPDSSNLDGAALVEGAGNKIRVRREGIFPFHTTNGETYKHGTKVYLANAAQTYQTITTTSAAGTLVGFVNLPDGSAVTGAAGVDVDVEIQPDSSNFAGSILSAA